MTLLDELKKKKKAIKDAFVNAYRRRRGNKQDKNGDGTPNPPAPAERPPSHAGSNWDDDEDMDNGVHTRPTRARGGNGQTSYSAKDDRRNRQEAISVEKKLSLDRDARPSQPSRNEAPRPVKKTREIFRRDPDPDIPEWKLQQWRESYGEMSSYEYKTSGEIRSRRMEEECHQAQARKPFDIPRPKCSYGRPSMTNSKPILPQKSTRAAGFVSRKPMIPQAKLHTWERRRSDFTHDWRVASDFLERTQRVSGARSNAPSTSKATASSRVFPEDPLDGLDDLLSEAEKYETSRDKRRSAPKKVPETAATGKTSRTSWGSGSTVSEDCEPLDKRRAERKKEIKILDALLKELDG